MKIEENKIQEYSGTSFNVIKNDGVSKIEFTDGSWIENKDYYGKIILGDCEDCLKITELYNDFTFDKILIAGLGLGLVPNYAKVVKNCSVIDVIENNSELISYVDYLDDSINIIEDDAFNYTPDKTYDLILFDLWWNELDITEEIQNSIREKYSSHLSEEGKILIPLLSKQL